MANAYGSFGKQVTASNASRLVGFWACHFPLTAPERWDTLNVRVGRVGDAAVGGREGGWLALKQEPHNYQTTSFTFIFEIPLCTTLNMAQRDRGCAVHRRLDDVIIFRTHSQPDTTHKRTYEERSLNLPSCREIFFFFCFLSFVIWMQLIQCEIIEFQYERGGKVVQKLYCTHTNHRLYSTVVTDNRPVVDYINKRRRRILGTKSLDIFWFADKLLFNLHYKDNASVRVVMKGCWPQP